MNSEQIAHLKRINAMAMANSKPEMSTMTVKVILGVVAVVAALGSLTMIAKAAGL